MANILIDGARDTVASNTSQDQQSRNCLHDVATSYIIWLIWSMFPLHLHLPFSIKTPPPPLAWPKKPKKWLTSQYPSLFMFCWPCIIVHQYSETNVMHFLFNLLRTEGLYMFRALLAHPQKALHKHHLVYCMNQGWSGTSTLVQPTDITHSQCTKCRLFSASRGRASNARNM
jgi:hypothetical protein